MKTFGITIVAICVCQAQSKVTESRVDPVQAMKNSISHAVTANATADAKDVGNSPLLIPAGSGATISTPVGASTSAAVTASTPTVAVASGANADQV
jgi:hypothetical protein